MNKLLFYKNEYYLEEICMLNLTTLFILMIIPALCVLSASFIVAFLEKKLDYTI